MAEWIKSKLPADKQCVFVTRHYDKNNEVYEYDLFVLTNDYYDDEANYMAVYTGNGEFYCLPDEFQCGEYFIIEYINENK